MQEIYTISDLMRFPGVQNRTIKEACSELKIKREKKRVHGYRQIAFTRKEFEKILQWHGFKLEGGNWIKVSVPDF